MPAKKTNDQFLCEAFNLVGHEYTFLEDYIHSNAKIKVKHNVCNFEYPVSPAKFLHGRRCPKCAGKLKRDLDMFIQEVFELTGNEYKVIDDVYSHLGTKIKHTVCDYEYSVIPSGFRQGNRCPKCRGFIKSTEHFKKEIKSVHGDKYTVLEEYINAKTKTKVRHNECGYEWDAILYNLAKGRGCPRCGNAILKTNDEFIEEVKIKGNGEYVALEEYGGANKKIKMEHLKCNHIYEVQPSNFLTGYRCPKCNQSKAEKEIYDILTREKIHFRTQVAFDDCRSINPLPFDFAIFDKNNKLSFLIEYDGEHHFIPIEFFGGEESLRDSIIRDNIKTSYCEKKNIKLIRITYEDKLNLNEIVMSLLDKYSLIQSKELVAL